MKTQLSPFFFTTKHWDDVGLLRYQPVEELTNGGYQWLLLVTFKYLMLYLLSHQRPF